LAVYKLSGAARKRSRRTWSLEEKRRIVEEAIRPGASIAEVARRHGLNANLVFAWRRILQPAPAIAVAASAQTLPASSNEPPSGAEAPEFIPIGVFALADDHGSELPPAAAAGRAPAPRTALEERPGVIEIGLADGARVRVDAFVNERALRRVLAALKASS
jgi:transposase